MILTGLPKASVLEMQIKDRVSVGDVDQLNLSQPKTQLAYGKDFG